MITARMMERADREADVEYRRSILIAMAANQCTQARLASALGISRNTLAARLRNPETMTRGEDRTLRRFLGMEGTI